MFYTHLVNITARNRAIAKNLEVSVGVKNLLNEEYKFSAKANTFEDDKFFQNGKRSYYVTLNYKF